MNYIRPFVSVLLSLFILTSAVPVFAEGEEVTSTPAAPATDSIDAPVIEYLHTTGSQAVVLTGERAELQRLAAKGDTSAQKKLEALDKKQNPSWRTVLAKNSRIITKNEKIKPAKVTKKIIAKKTVKKVASKKAVVKKPVVTKKK